MAAIFVSPSPSFSHYPSFDSQPEQENFLTVSSADLKFLSANLKKIKEEREITRCAHAKKKDLQQLIAKIKAILAESGKNGLHVLLSRNEEARQHLIDIQTQIRVLAPNKTLCGKIRSILAKPSFETSSQPPSVNSEREKTPYQEIREEKCPIDPQLSLKQEFLEELRSGATLSKLLEKNLARAIEICILCLNSHVNSDLANIRRELISHLSGEICYRLENRSEIIEGLAQNLHRITGVLPKPSEDGSIFTYNLLLSAKNYRFELAKAKIEAFINHFQFYTRDDMPFAAVWPAYREGIEASINKLLDYRMLNETLVYERIGDFINHNQLPLNSWEFLLDKQDIIEVMMPHLRSKIIHLNQYECSIETRVRVGVAFPNARLIEVIPETSIALDKLRDRQLLK